MTMTDVTLVSHDEAAAAAAAAAAEGSVAANVPSAVDVCCAPLTRETITAADAETFARRLKALADPVRLRLVSIVAASEGQEACVCDLIDPVGVGQPTVSHHLKILTEAGFLSRSKRGTWAYYRLVPGALDAAAAPLISV